MSQAFYMNYVEGGSNPVVTYSHPDRAETEAKRLAKLTGKKVFILSSYKSVEVNEFTIKDCTPGNDDLPF